MSTPNEQFRRGSGSVHLPFTIYDLRTKSLIASIDTPPAYQFHLYRHPLGYAGAIFDQNGRHVASGWEADDEATLIDYMEIALHISDYAVRRHYTEANRG